MDPVDAAGTTDAADAMDAAGTVDAVDGGLLKLRRLWAKPSLRRAPAGERLINLSYLLVINAIGHAVDECGAAVSVGRVAERLDVDPSTASRLVADAIDAGFVSRTPSATDARRADLELTPAGRRVREIACRYRRDYLAGLMADWTAAERREFARLLTRFAAAAAAAPPAPDRAHAILKAACGSTRPSPGSDPAATGDRHHDRAGPGAATGRPVGDQPGG